MTSTITPKGQAGSVPVYCSHDAIVDIEQMQANPKNPNTHPEIQIEMLSKIIEEQGWRQPIKVSKRSGYIVSGHGRYQAALFLGVAAVPVDFQDYATEEEELADLLADNRIAELAELDEKKLSELFSGLDLDSIEIDLTGYTQDVVNGILDAIETEGLDEEEIEGETPFTEELREEHNYIVLYFDNEVDWLQAESLFDLQTVKAFPTRKDGTLSENMERRGVGRVINGAKALEVLRSAYQCELSII